MAEKKQTKEGGLIGAAKAVGTAAGKIAALAGIAEPAPPAKSMKKPKLAKKNKSRLPRRRPHATREHSYFSRARFDGAPGGVRDALPRPWKTAP